MAISRKEKFSIGARALIMVACLAAAILVFKSKLNSFSCLENYKTTFMYFAVLHIIATIYNFLTLLLPYGSGLWRFVVLLDMIFLVLLSTSLTALSVTYTHMKNGNCYVGWPRICNEVPEFCSKILGALITSAIGCGFSFVLLCIILQYAVDYLITN